MDNARNDSETRQTSTLIQRTASRKPVIVGDMINGKYLVEQLIGEGGVGIVLAAQNVELDERVALKFLKPEMLVQPDVVARFAREAKAACAIKSEYVCSVYDVGTMPDGQPFLVMEYLDGQNLDTVLRDRGRFGYREAAEYVMQVCEALAAAHAKGIVHRDIKPENLFLATRAGMSIVKVLDFGISKTALTGSIFGSALPLVKTVNLMGSPCYMSPEQVRSADTVDSRSDIWSVGVVLYELVTGHVPFAGATITELCATILEKPMDPVATYRDDLPRGFVPIIEKCLHKDMEQRYRNVAELAIALLPFAPRRARICAERAVQALRATGILQDAEVKILSTVPPAEDRQSAGSHPQIRIPKASSTGPIDISGETPPPPPSAGALVAEATVSRGGRNPSWVAFVGAIVVAVAAAAVFALRTHPKQDDAASTHPSAVVTDPPRAPQSNTTTTATAAATTKPAATDTLAQPGPAPGAPRAPNAAGAESAARVAPPPVSAPLIGTRRVPVPPNVGVGVGRPPAPRSTATGKKSPDEPDLGY